MKTKTESRRQFLTQASGLAAGTLAVAATGSALAATAASTGKGGSSGYMLQSKAADVCGTCEYWGGQRKLSADGSELTIGGLGWCNNPASPNYGKLTSAQHGPMPAWKRWSLIG